MMFRIQALGLVPVRDVVLAATCLKATRVLVLTISTAMIIILRTMDVILPVPSTTAMKTTPP